MRVLITGAAGWTAAPIIEAVRQAGHQIIAFDLRDAGEGSSAMRHATVGIKANVASFNDVIDAMRSAEAVIHLAVAVEEGAYLLPDMPFAVNVLGTYNVFEAARRSGVHRIVLMSSAAVHLPLTAGEKLDAFADWRSEAGEDHLYDLTKRLQEEIARDFCATCAMSAVALRAGHIVDGRAEVDPHGRPLEQLDYARGGWVCRYDLAQACVRALTLSSTGYNAFHVIGSREATACFDIERTERELGLRFASRFARYERLASETNSDITP